MLRLLAGLLVGLLVAAAVLSAVNALGHVYYPLPADLDYDDMDAVRHFVNGQPLAALGWVLAAFLAGGFAGGFASGWVIGPAHHYAAMVPPALVASAVLAMHRMAPHPLWLVVLGVGGALVLGWTGAGIGWRLPQPFQGKAPTWRGGSR
jgi:hypothetical protein